MNRQAHGRATHASEGRAAEHQLMAADTENPVYGHIRAEEALRTVAAHLERVAAAYLASIHSPTDHSR